MWVLVLIVLCFAVPIKPTLAALLDVYYESEIKSAFKHFNQFDGIFQQVNVHFKPFDVPICTNGPFSPSSPCSKTRDTIIENFSSTSTKQMWRKAGPTLEQAFAKQGWRRIMYADTPNPDIANLLDAQAPPFQIDIIYVKKIDKADCDIDFEYMINSRFDVSESCTRMGTKTHFW